MKSKALVDSVYPSCKNCSKREECKRFNSNHFVNYCMEHEYAEYED